MSIILSVIIPIYNVEHYILDCLRSVIEQMPHEGVEVILVNDGSQDGTLNIMMDYLNKLDKVILQKITILEQKNMGQSIARNNALNIARGDYIAFLDADDTYEPTFFQRVMDVIYNYNPEVIRFGSHLFDNIQDDKNIFTKVERSGLIKNDIENILYIFNESAWFSMFNVYKKSFFRRYEIS